MTLNVYEWISGTQQERWLCPHVKKLLAQLQSSSGNHMHAVGLINYKSPEAVVFMEQPLDESVVLEVIKQIPQLQAVRNGIDQLIGVSCSQDYVSIEYKKKGN